MARAVGKLKSVDVKRLGPGKHSDGGGLYLVVTTGATRNWCFRYMKAGKSHEMGLGPLHTVSLAEARERARRCRQQLLDGIDPLAHRRVAKAVDADAVSFEAVAGLYIAAHSLSWKSEVHSRQWNSTLRDHVFPPSDRCPSTRSTRAP